MIHDPANELLVLGALRQGDDRALDQIIERWGGPLHAFAWRYVQNTADARELVAEAFVRLHQQRARLRPDTNVGAWLFTIVANLCHNQNRWRKRHPSVSLDAQDEETGQALSDRIPTEAPLPSDRVERDEALAALRKAIDTLPHDLKTTLILHHYEHLSYREIGKITECSERGVETRLYRAKQRLREELAKYMSDETAHLGTAVE
ncbi:MAG: RNA polymerase sigma factor [Opitutaceae bacterium]